MCTDWVEIWKAVKIYTVVFSVITTFWRVCGTRLLEEQPFLIFADGGRGSHIIYGIWANIYQATDWNIQNLTHYIKLYVYWDALERDEMNCIFVTQKFHYKFVSSV